MSCWNKILILLVILIVSLVIFFYTKPLKIPRYLYNNSSYSPSKKYGFTGVKIKDLIQSKKFYKKYREKTMNYLVNIYPLSIKSLESLGDLELASFYNSLNYYVNCEFKYTDENGNLIFNSLPCSKTSSLPYPPQGWFFNFYTYQKNDIPFIYSDSNPDKEEQKLQNFGSNRPGIGFVDLSERERAGPGPFWLKPRTLIRNTYFPNGLSFTKQKNGIEWNYVSAQPISWNYPKNWIKGVKDNDFVEVTHTQPVPGMVESLGWWWNGVCGSGLFLNVGKSLRCINKIDAGYQLLSLLPQNFLVERYNTSDPNQILFGIIGMCGIDNVTNINYCDFRYTDCKFWCENDYQGVLKISNLPISKFYDEIVRFQKMNGISQIDTPTKEGIIAAISASRDNSDYRLSRVSSKVLLDESLFFWGLNAEFDTIQMSYSVNGNGYYCYEIIDLRLPERYLSKAKQRDYSDFIDLNEVSEERLNQMAKDNVYKKEFIQSWIEKFIDEDIVTVRDPLDIYNKDKVEKCIIKSIFDKVCNNNLQYDQSWYSFYCENVPLSNDTRCISLGEDAEPMNICDLKSENPSC